HRALRARSAARPLVADADAVTHRIPRTVPVAKLVRPAAAQLRLDVIEAASTVIRVVARNMAKVIGRPAHLERAILGSGAGPVMLAVVRLSVVGPVAGDDARVPHPPSANRAGNRPDRRTDRSAHHHSRSSAGDRTAQTAGRPSRDLRLLL